MLSIGIIDDEENARYLLRNELEKTYASHIDLIHEAENVVTGLALVQNCKIDILFLDIELGDGNAFQILEAIDDFDFSIIFVTAYNKFALKAFEFFAFGYIVKPFKKSELKTVVDRYLEDKVKTSKSSVRILSESIYDKKIKKIILPDMDGFRVIHLSDVLYVKSDNNYSDFVLLNEQRFLSSRTLKDYEKILGDQGFFRSHRQYLVNLDHVSGYSNNDGGYIKMDTGKIIPIGRRKVAEFRKIFL
ncbi:MAG: LytTR family DNA-binding domain-containing protein [Bacteroidia bacterium]|nr:LytTR family DNA-binding domain-containing protein [Bacteroidia bacterium]